ncbi:MAG TPA: X-Pro dipeptidyl-peptidase [Dehalococcoidia bacterium]|nr:CocE/NonD family hydrolase [SAR202 cluster bacterium]MDP6665499.1 CocE/NonD family hydrolase [SAR202 cluster bacterium]HAL48711.1 X-Pro dipeptidyl-peptidase [Dehalococcoidia bacterium]|tara:strand:- start:6375 stop:8129 length:1755 start_codon:yes stop_codon:yes gene_type:complete
MPGPYSVKFEYNVAIMMRDGTTTYADVFRPDVAGKTPALLSRTPYDKSAPANRTGTLDAIRGAMSGYAVVVQDVRGRYSSDGVFYTFVNEIDDGYDSVEWVASQPWCDGNVGMYGVSYVGATQWLTAKSNAPSLKAIVPGVTASDYHEGWTWQGGAFELGFNLSWAMGGLTAANWTNISRRLHLHDDDLERLIVAKDNLTDAYRHLPMAEMPHLMGELAPYYYDWLDHPEYDDYWKTVSIEESHSDITVPAFNFGGWHDIFLGGTIRNFTRMRELGATESARNGQRLLIGPWVHGGAPTNVSGAHNFGTRAAAAEIDLQGQMLRFYDHWLKGEDNGVSDDKPVRIFVMGENVWRSEDEWPLSRANIVNFYLHSAGKANSLSGDGRLSQELPNGEEEPDVYAYNPLNPVPTLGGGLCCDVGFMAAGVYDQRRVEGRDDVLVYSTPPLGRDVEVTGPISVTLFASSSAFDTDFTAKLVDVDPAGYARNLTDGIVRARYRFTRQPASLLQPGQVYEFTIDLWATSNLFKQGHSIRLEVSSSNFPRFDRNTNTGEAIGSDAEHVSALQHVFHTSEYPSHVKLPLIPRD